MILWDFLDESHKIQNEFQRIVKNLDNEWLHILHIFLQVISFMHVTAQESDSVNMADGAGHYDLPRLTLTMRPGQTNSELEDELASESEEELDVMTMSTGEALLGLTATQPSPFSKKRRIHKGDNHRDDGNHFRPLTVLNHLFKCMG